MENDKIKKTSTKIKSIKEEHDDISSSRFSQMFVARRKNRRKIILGILVLIIVIFLISFVKTQRELTKLRTSAGQQEIVREEIEKIVEQVKKHILIPEGEVPTMATVVNAQELIAEQPFYSGAQDGDKVLLYLEIQRAIIYSPERDIIVNVGPLVLED